MDDVLYWIVGWAIVAITAAAAAGILSAVKNRDYSFWMAWSFLIPPLLLILLFLPRFKGERPRRPTLDEQEKHW